MPVPKPIDDKMPKPTHHTTKLTQSCSGTSQRTHSSPSLCWDCTSAGGEQLARRACS